jgi:hypothetical protein
MCVYGGVWGVVLRGVWGVWVESSSAGYLHGVCPLGLSQHDAQHTGCVFARARNEGDSQPGCLHLRCDVRPDRRLKDEI